MTQENKNIDTRRYYHFIACNYMSQVAVCISYQYFINKNIYFELKTNRVSNISPGGGKYPLRIDPRFYIYFHGKCSNNNLFSHVSMCRKLR